MMEQTFDLLTLALLPEVGPRCVRDLSARAALQDVLRHPEEHADRLPSEARGLLRSGEARRRAEEEERRAAKEGVRIVGRDEGDYPDLLRQIYDPPPVLYCRGRLEKDEGARSVAVVGSRRASPYGSTLARAVARDLAKAGVTVVSGLARGIDTAAHRGALDGQGRTVAVLGSGLDRMYPPENAALAQAVAEIGAVVSEFPFGSAPLPGNFPRRNRVIAGWGRVTVVVEAAERSGALVTARSALDEGREVLAVPGHPSHACAAGTNQLIRDGAVLVRGADDILLEMGLVALPAKSAPVPAIASAGAPGPAIVSAGAPTATDAVLGALRGDAPSSLDDLQARSGRPISEILGRLAELEVEDKVRRLPGALFVKQG